MANQKHLTLEERTVIQSMLDNRSSFSEIANALGKDCTTISKEVRGHLVFRRVGYQRVNYNACAHRFSCDRRNVCTECKSDKAYKLCRRCFPREFILRGNKVHDRFPISLRSSARSCSKSHMSATDAAAAIPAAPLKSAFTLPQTRRRNIWAPSQKRVPDSP